MRDPALPSNAAWLTQEKSRGHRLLLAALSAACDADGVSRNRERRARPLPVAGAHGELARASCVARGDLHRRDRALSQIRQGQSAPHLARGVRAAGARPDLRYVTCAPGPVVRPFRGRTPVIARQMTAGRRGGLVPGAGKPGVPGTAAITRRVRDNDVIVKVAAVDEAPVSLDRAATTAKATLIVSVRAACGGVTRPRLPRPIHPPALPEPGGAAGGSDRER